MAKSTRSKVKRSHRAKKRETGVYAAVEAARLQRLNAKLVALTTQEAANADIDADDDEGRMADESGSSPLAGWCWFASFGLLDPDAISPEALGRAGLAGPSADAVDGAGSLAPRRGRRACSMSSQ
jgi:Protein of unknown function (DUF2423)